MFHCVCVCSCVCALVCACVCMCVCVCVSYPSPDVGRGVDDLLEVFVAEAVDERFGGETVVGVAPDLQHVWGGVSERVLNRRSF